MRPNCPRLTLNAQSLDQWPQRGLALDSNTLLPGSFWYPNPLFEKRTWKFEFVIRFQTAFSTFKQGWLWSNLLSKWFLIEISTLVSYFCGIAWPFFPENESSRVQSGTRQKNEFLALFHHDHEFVATALLYTRQKRMSYTVVVSDPLVITWNWWSISLIFYFHARWLQILCILIYLYNFSTNLSWIKNGLKMT